MEAADRRMRALMAIGAAGSAGLGAVVLRTARAAALDEMVALEGLLGREMMDEVRCDLPGPLNNK